MRIRLSDPDRERLGCPEWLDFDVDHLSLEDAEALEAAGGDYQKYFGSGPSAVRVRVWVALHRAGVTVTPIEALTVNLMGMLFEGVTPGKAPSANGGKPTRSTSGTSSRPSRRRTSGS